MFQAETIGEPSRVQELEQHPRAKIDEMILKTFVPNYQEVTWTLNVGIEVNHKPLSGTLPVNILSHEHEKMEY